MTRESSSQDSKRYWRSLDRLLDSPAVQEGMQAELERKDTPEFPLGADLPPDAVTRRTMMTLMGASFALAGLEGCRRPVEKIVPFVDAPETMIPGVARHFATTMPLGASAYGVVVESHDGRPTKIEGNELHPASKGAASTWMQASILGLYDTDRSTHVMRRAEGGEAAAEDDHGDDHGEGGAHPATHIRATWADFEAFWQERLGALGDGSGLAVLSGEYASPTMARVRANFEARFPAARWVVSEPAGDANVFAGAKLATGGAHRPLYHVENASVIVSLDADFMNTESDSVRNARGYADGRRVASKDDTMNRLYAVESSFTVTGSAADHRIRLKSGDVAGMAAALATELGVPAPAGVITGHADEYRAMVDDLKAAGVRGLVIAGRRQPPEVHALALAINQALGAIGTTVTVHDLQDVGYGGPDALAGLVADIDSGAVNTLVILGSNPAYQASADVDFAGAMGKLAHSVHVSMGFDETSRLAEWHLPGTHYLEAWGDARSSDGTLSVVQPLIAPLLDGRSEIEIANLVTTGAHTSGYDLVRESWNSVLGADLFENQWSKVLHDGLLEDSATAPLDLVMQDDIANVTLPSESGMEITFHLASDVHDGRYANNGWLQELPDVMTKITWDNAALVSAATAKKIGLDVWDDGEGRLKVQKATLNLGGHSLEVPVFVMPGQADDSIAVHLGYGRTAAGRVGDDVGFSAYKLRPSSTPWFAGGADAKKAEGRHMLAQTQEHWAMPSTRPILVEESLEHYQEDPHFMHHKVHMPADSQLFDYHDYGGDYQWGMTIDLSSCIGCNACVVACQSENNIPIVGKEQIAKGREMHWLRVDRYFAHDYNGMGTVSAADLASDPQVAFQPIPCMHCENAPCEQVCPVAATTHDSEGINGMTYNRCIGTRYCSNNCPYKVRRFNFFNYTKDTPELLKMAQNPDVTVRSRGVMEKCTYCVQRISEAKIGAKAEGRKVRDGEIQTACQQTCPTQAISFGNIQDPESQVEKLKKNDRNYQLLGELNNRPRTSFLARLRNPNSHWPGSSAAGHHSEGESEA